MVSDIKLRIACSKKYDQQTEQYHKVITIIITILSTLWLEGVMLTLRGGCASAPRVWNFRDCHYDVTLQGSRFYYFT